jgi:hypothetical protein
MNLSLWNDVIVIVPSVIDFVQLVSITTEFVSDILFDCGGKPLLTLTSFDKGLRVSLGIAGVATLVVEEKLTLLAAQPLVSMSLTSLLLV